MESLKSIKINIHPEPAMSPAGEGNDGEYLRLIFGCSLNGEALQGSTFTWSHWIADGTCTMVNSTLSEEDIELLESMRGRCPVQDADITRITFRAMAASDSGDGSERLEVGVLVEANREEVVGMPEEEVLLERMREADTKLGFHGALPPLHAQESERLGVSIDTVVYRAEGEEVAVLREEEFMQTVTHPQDHERDEDVIWIIRRTPIPSNATVVAELGQGEMPELEEVVEHLEGEEYEEAEEMPEEEEEYEDVEETPEEEEEETEEEEIEEIVDQRMSFVAQYVYGAKRRRLQEGTKKFYDTTHEDEICTICLSEIMVGEEVVRTPCFHQFHASCIMRWFETAGCCPLCRFEIGESSDV